MSCRGASLTGVAGHASQLWGDGRGSSWSVVEGLVAAFGVEGELSDELPLVEDVAGETGNDDGDGVPDVGGTEGDVVTGTDADDSVGAHFEVAYVGGLVEGTVSGSGFGGGGVNLGGDTPVEAAMGTGVVVDVGELVELCLQLLERRCSGLGG